MILEYTIQFIYVFIDNRQLNIVFPVLVSRRVFVWVWMRDELSWSGPRIDVPPRIRMINIKFMNNVQLLLRLWPLLVFNFLFFLILLGQI